MDHQVIKQCTESNHVLSMNDVCICAPEWCQEYNHNKSKNKSLQTIPGSSEPKED